MTGRAAGNRVAPWLDDGDVQLYHGDVIQTLRALPAGIAQTCVTSPPYWGLRDYGTGAWTGGGGCALNAADSQHIFATCRLAVGHEGRCSAHCDHMGPPKASIRSTLKNDGRPPERVGQNEYERGACVPYTDVCGRCGARRVDSQLGLEPTPQAYVERMVAVFREVWRVLRDDGTLWLNLGDSYAGSWGNQGRKEERGGQRPVNGPKFQPNDERYPSTNGSNTGAVPPGLKPKDLVGIPWRVAFALQADGWYLRSDIIWSKPNPMPESVTDRPTKAHEYLFLLSKRPRYYWDADAVREPHSRDWWHENRTHPGNPDRNDNGTVTIRNESAGRNCRSVWTIPTQPFPEAHFATYPEELVRPCILAGSSERGECSVCGAPWVREVEETAEYAAWKAQENGWAKRSGDLELGRGTAGSGTNSASVPTKHSTTGWRASCTCNAAIQPQTVLDPFIGSGTTALVARKHGRRCIGIDLSSEYLDIAARRLQQLSLFADQTGHSEDTPEAECV